MRGRVRAVAAIIGVLGAAVASAPSAAAPPDDTFELTVTPTGVTQGDELALSGTCYSEVIGTADDVFVRLARRVPPGSGLIPYSVSVTLDVDLADSTFSGVLPVPLDAPAGDYRVGGFCRWADQAIPVPDTMVVITGEPTTTTTTSSTTTTEVGPTIPPPPPAPPATAVEDAARLTG
jgi:hypothetical protein